MFSEQLYHSHLKTNIFGGKLKYSPKTESTSKIIWEMIHSRKGYEGMISITDHQTSGRGRRGNSWFSLPNLGLTFSILLYPKLPIEKLGLISLFAGVACAKGIQNTTQIKVQLKWPNDIVFQQSKLGGVLAENHKIENKNVVVLGIGVNINEELNDFPSYLQHTATSLRNISNNLHKREIILAEIINQLEKLIQADVQITNEWKTFCSHLNSNVKFHYGNELLYGRFIDLNEQGHALIKINNKIRTFSSGEIQV